MIKLGLVGSNISHSKSPVIYKQLLSVPHSYDLIDVHDEKELPLLTSLQDYFGLNITSPYKLSYLAQLSSYPLKWKAVNCIKKKDGDWIGTNTDATALEELIPSYAKKYDIKKWIILGDGAMATVTRLILTDQRMSFTQHSRKMGDDFDRFSFFDQLDPIEQACVVNCCSRDLVIKSSLSRNWMFWDFNYLHTTHSNSMPAKVKEYIDGESLLITQAKHAVKFWGLA